MDPADDASATYRKADRRLRDLLLGDGTYTAGLAKGEEKREQVARELNRMREALAALRESADARAEAAEARAEAAEVRANELEQTLEKIASTRTRRRSKSA